MKTEQEYLDLLSAFQIEIVNTLKSLGYKHEYFSVYSHYLKGEGKISVDVSNLKDLKDLIIKFYNEGADQKRFEFQRLLGV